MRIEWSARSKKDIQALKQYIGQDSPYYAQRFIAKMIASVEKLADFSELGRKVPEAEDRNDIRELIYQGYRIIYLTQPEYVFIITIIHGSRDLSAKENQLWNEEQN